MTYTAGSQGASAPCGATFMATLDTLLVAAGFTFVEQWPPPSPVLVRAASTANVISLSGAQTIDGVALVAGDRVLLKNQTTTTQNGIYVVASGAWTRATDADATGEIMAGTVVQVTAGTTLASQFWVCSSVTVADPWVPGTSSTNWVVTTWTGRVYKSPAASNVFGQDWYLLVLRAVDSGFVSLSVAEVWDSTLKTVRNYPPTSLNLVPTAAFAVNDAVGVKIYLGNKNAITVGTSTAGFTYWVSANPNRVVLATRVGATDYGGYAGLYDDFLPVAISPFPLCVVNLAAGAFNVSTWGAATREPNQLGATVGNFMVWVSSTGIWTLTTTVVSQYNAKYIAGRVELLSGRSATLGTNVRGLLKNVLYAAPAGAVNGDTLTCMDLAGATTVHTRMSDTSLSFWVDQAA